jgi:hypothetical protein
VDFNAKARRRKDAKQILARPVQAATCRAMVGELIPPAGLAPLRLCVKGSPRLQNVKDQRAERAHSLNVTHFAGKAQYFVARLTKPWHSERMSTKTEQAAQTETAGSTGRARTGKIAKLPSAIREELNSRLAEGEATEAILQWLNGLPEVRAHLEAHHQGSPISAMNLSRWRAGGFAGWAENMQVQDSLEAMTLACSELDEEAREKMVRRIGTVLMSRLICQMQRFDAMPEGPEKTRFWGEIVWSYIGLRRADLNYEEFMFERKKATQSTMMLQLHEGHKQ